MPLMAPRKAFSIFLCFSLCAVVNAQTDAPSINALSQTVPPSPVSVNGVSQVPIPSISQHSLSYDPGPFLSWATESATIPTANASASTKSNKGKIAGGVVGGLAVLVAAIAALVFLRFRRKRSTTHWRNRANGLWRDTEAKNEGAVYVGHSSDDYFPDFKLPVPPSPTTAPVLIREPRLTQSAARGHTRTLSSTHPRNDSMELHGISGSATNDASRF
ncbi:hypothetical protein R3P38DRAFT_1168313 [Favolaschia claudopus]|uniref:Uncharacterized protein n=1 Tax=Favolaschia claudopus TaxID=2862362 RepID=A0AAW0DWJ5_9AGAR